MLFHVRMDVSLPHGMSEAEAEVLKRVEREKAQALQAEGKWRHLWRIVGQYSNVSVFDVENAEELHQLLTGLPLFPYMTIQVMPLCRHPSSIHADDR
ncbi:muconolactone delta-isomerase [Crenobacter luteus]|uniref:Muconolactone Delta-isomerase n=1 Tax=Crenobacter luteus TaxID=1452487 RepID=A0A165ELU1_9NEIS|nr:muconolactone Delta-isomerase [Crenobacter luteus]KZE25873.1 muconolactone delta-isomerase [Crenobacter luteus]TCP14569.1 muconolactone delta-isomerase [Crenobacter luteus]